MSGCSRNPDTKLKFANLGISWNLEKDFLSDEASMARAGIRSSGGSPEKPQFAHPSSGQILLSELFLGLGKLMDENQFCGH